MTTTREETLMANTRTFTVEITVPDERDNFSARGLHTLLERSMLGGRDITVIEVEPPHVHDWTDWELMQSMNDRRVCKTCGRVEYD